ncbi:hypothetical protein [Paraburkholderia sp.]|uniref:hypothetical protein n=1 Tax=Paraburkholderia sp. TaxID=1926495 RepID=UPI0039E33E60
MRGPTEQRRRGSATGPFLVLLALVMICGAAWLWVTPVHREFGARIGVAVLFAYVWAAALRFQRNMTVAEPPSNFDLCLNRSPPAPRFDPLFLRMRDELTGSIRSQSYFLHVLWPRLVALSRQYESPLLSPPRQSRLPWQGQSLDALDQLIARIESGEAKRP